MAKKKEFDNIVDESFNEGYQSEPEINSTPNTSIEEVRNEQPERKLVDEKLSENEIRLRKIRAQDPEVLNQLWGKEDRSTYYLTDLNRACIDIMAHEEGLKKQEIVVDALNKYFSEDVIEAAKDRVVTMAIKKLEREIKKENK